MKSDSKLESEVNTGFWVSNGRFWGPINSGLFELTKDRIIIISRNSKENYSVSRKGRILDPNGKDTGYFFDERLGVYGLEYGTLPWMNEKAKEPIGKPDSPADYGMEI